MPISYTDMSRLPREQKGWRSQRHIDNAVRDNCGKKGVSFLRDMENQCRLKRVETRNFGTMKTTSSYRLTPKGRAWLKKNSWLGVLEAFAQTEQTKQSCTRLQLELDGWYSAKHVGEVPTSLLEGGLYESMRFDRGINHLTYYRLTTLGKQCQRARIGKEEWRKHRKTVAESRAKTEKSIKSRSQCADDLVVVGRDDPSELAKIAHQLKKVVVPRRAKKKHSRNK